MTDDLPDPDSHGGRERELKRIAAPTPLEDTLTRGLLAELDRLAARGIGPAKLARLSDAARIHDGAVGIARTSIFALRSGKARVSVTQLEQLAATGLLDLDEVVAAGDGLPSRAELAREVLNAEAWGSDGPWFDRVREIVRLDDERRAEESKHASVGGES